MSRPKTRPDPNAADPLSEPTLNRRLWAAYLHRGYTRYSFAKAIGSTYANINDYDKGAKTPRLDKLMLASELLGFSMDELCFGRERAQRGVEPELSVEQMKAVLLEVRASPEARDVLREYARSQGELQRFTRSFVAGFAETYDAERANKRPHVDALQLAKEEAMKRQATADTVAMQAVAPHSRVQLAQLGREADGKALVSLPGGNGERIKVAGRRSKPRKAAPSKRRNV